MFISDLGCFLDLTFCKLSHPASWTTDLSCKRNAQSQDHSSSFPSHSFFYHLFLFPLWHFPSSLILFCLPTLYLQSFIFYSDMSSLATFPAPCWISTKERKVFSQPAIAIKHSRIPAEQENSLKLETYCGFGRGFLMENLRTC